MDPIGAPPPGIERLARLYRALSDTNKAIVRMRDRGSLFREVRRIAVELAGLEFAWLGLLGDERVEREPVATLAAVALCSGGSHVCNHLPNEMAPYRAGAALLLREGGRVVGVMALLADHEGCFDRALLDLVEEMATDVSYALENLAREARRAAAESSLRKLSHAVEQSSAATVITDVEGRIEYANPKFTEISGYTLEEVRGRALLGVRDRVAGEERGRRDRELHRGEGGHHRAQAHRA